MAEKEKVTIMILDVDLQCWKCYKKVKKVLCKFPQIRDQVYDEKNNKVIIKVVCCSPEKIRDKLCCKGRGSIKRIEIKEPEKPNPKPPPTKEPVNPKPPPRKEPVNPKPPPHKEPENPKPILTVPVCYPPAVPLGTCCSDCYNGRRGGPCEIGWPGAPQFEYGGYCGRPVPLGTCCSDCYNGRHGGPCEMGWPGAPQFEYGYGGCYESRRCVNYCSEENPQGCSIM